MTDLDKLREAMSVGPRIATTIGEMLNDEDETSPTPVLTNETLVEPKNGFNIEPLRQLARKIDLTKVLLDTLERDLRNSVIKARSEFATLQTELDKWSTPEERN